LQDKRIGSASGAAVSGVDLRQVGSIDLTDLDIISTFYGRDFLPYPFMLTRPSRFSTQREFDEYARSVPDRFNNGDLRVFGRCWESYAHADIRVECHVQYIPADTASIRAVAYRVGDLGYLAKQRAEEDVIDVYELSPYDLGPAIADSVVLTKPGSRSEIVIPEYAPPSDNAYAAEDFSVRSTIPTTTTTEIRRAKVTAFARVQSHWQPTRCWGFDSGKNAVMWVRIKDDGEYIYETDFSLARPMDRRTLAERTDRLIAEDVKALRDFRNGWY
jgi:hypothetical protein